MITHTITRKWASSGSSISKSETIEGSGESNIDQAIDASAVDVVVNYNIDISKLKSLYMVASKDMVVVPQAADDGEAMTQIDLEAGVPYVWTEGSGLDNPFAEDVEGLEVTNSEASEGLFQIRSLYDATPATTS